MISCHVCEKEFKTRNALYKHTQYYNGKCTESIQAKQDNKRKRNEVKEKLNELTSSDLLEALDNHDRTTEANERIKELEILNKNLECKVSSCFEFPKYCIPKSMEVRRSMTEPQRRLILENQGYKCAGKECKLTSLSGHAYDIDHVIPLEFGGPDSFDNKQALCMECHRNKTDFERTLRSSLQAGGSQSVVFPDSWPHVIPNAIYSKHVNTPILVHIV